MSKWITSNSKIVFLCGGGSISVEEILFLVSPSLYRDAYAKKRKEADSGKMCK